MTAFRIEKVREPTRNVLSYLEADVVRNAVDIWSLTWERSRYQLSVCFVDSEVRAHLGIYDTPEAKYTSLGGAREAAEALLRLVPSKAVLTVPPDLGKTVKMGLKHDAVYPNDIMVVERGKEALDKPESARRLTPADATEYSTFGSSFNVGEASRRWARNRLVKNVIFGTFCNGKLVSVASLVAWLPEVAVVMGVETKHGFRRRGFGSSVVSAALKEALRRSTSCSLFVRSDNKAAIGLYRKLGFQKFGEELWIDIGTGIVP